jgi:hypothetical protein
VNEHPEPDERGSDGGGLGADAQNETIGKVVDRKPQHERPERVLAELFFCRVVRMGAREHLGQEQEDETSDEARDGPFPCELQTLGEQVRERQREQDPGR